MEVHSVPPSSVSLRKYRLKQSKLHYLKSTDFIGDESWKRTYLISNTLIVAPSNSPWEGVVSSRRDSCPEKKEKRNTFLFCSFHSLFEWNIKCFPKRQLFSPLMKDETACLDRVRWYLSISLSSSVFVCVCVWKLFVLHTFSNLSLSLCLSVCLVSVPQRMTREEKVSRKGKGDDERKDFLFPLLSLFSR